MYYTCMSMFFEANTVCLNRQCLFFMQIPVSIYCVENIVHGHAETNRPALQACGFSM